MADLNCSQPKERRRNSEKRKEKSRDAARCRRSKESEIFADLALALPLPASITSQLDKASIMRLTIAYLKARHLMTSYAKDADGCSSGSGSGRWLDSLVTRMLDGFLIILSAVGDIIYVTESVNYHLGLTQFDLIGQNIFDYSHPCDHNEVREALELRPDGVDHRSFFARFKCTLTTKGRSVNLKSASYKVINCTGRVVTAQGSFADDEDLAIDQPSDYLILVGEPLPYPGNIEGPMANQTFVTKHAMDLKFVYVDDKIEGFLGYTPEELEGKSAYEFHHVLDTDVISKNFKTLLAKGQSQTSSYRFLARNGGYVWLQTQSSVVYGSRDARPQAIVCVHHVLSDIEEGDQVLSLAQSLAASAGTLGEKKTGHQLPRRAKVDSGLPELSTAKIFAPRTADMSQGFLTFDDKEGSITVFKEEPEDLTHLAPMAGDACIPLELSGSLIPLTDLLEDISLPPGILDCFPLTGFDFTAEADFNAKPAVPCPPEQEEEDADNAVSVTSSLFNSRDLFGNKDPFVFSTAEEDPSVKEPRAGTSKMSDEDMFLSTTVKTGAESYGDYVSGMELEAPLETEMSFSPLNLNYSPDFNMHGSPVSDHGSARSTLSSLNNDASSDVEDFSLYRSVPLRTIEQLENCPALSRQQSLQFTDLNSDEEDFETRAPFIPMGETDDLPLFSCEDMFFDSKMDDILFGCNSMLNGDIQPTAESNLAQLLQQQTPPVDRITERIFQQKKPAPPKESLPPLPKPVPVPVVKETAESRGLKRAFSCPVDSGINKRPKGPELFDFSAAVAALAAEPKVVNKVAKSKMNGGRILLEKRPPSPKREAVIPEQLPTFKAKLPCIQPQQQQQMLMIPPKVQQQQQSSSVLLNLLVSGHDDETGYSVNGQNGRSKTAALPEAAKSLSISSDKTSPPIGAKAKPRSAKEQLQQQLRARRPVLLKSTSTISPLLSLTSRDCEVNAPLQSTAGLLHGDDILGALDFPSAFESAV